MGIRTTQALPRFFLALSLMITFQGLISAGAAPISNRPHSVATLSENWDEAIPLSVKLFLIANHLGNSSIGNLQGMKPDTAKFYLIPIERTSAHLIKSFPKSWTEASGLQATLFEEKSGRQFYRWIKHPDDEHEHLSIRRQLQQWGEDSELRSDPSLVTYRTASRSVVIFNRKNRAFFSLKTGTDHTYGLWQEKGLTGEQVERMFEFNEFIFSSVKGGALPSADLIPEPFAVTVNGLFGSNGSQVSIAQGQIVRDLSSLKGTNIYLPAFVAVHPVFGPTIAWANGSQNPKEFWKENLFTPLGKTVAEFVWETAHELFSMHLQNVWIEFNSDLQPTGRVKIIDFGDTVPNEDLLRPLLALDSVKKLMATRDSEFAYHREIREAGTLDLQIGINKGSNPYFSREESAELGNAFKEAAFHRLAEVSGLAESDFRASMISETNRDGYEHAICDLKKPVWRDFSQRQSKHLALPRAYSVEKQKIRLILSASIENQFIEGLRENLLRVMFGESPGAELAHLVSQGEAMFLNPAKSLSKHSRGLLAVGLIYAGSTDLAVFRIAREANSENLMFKKFVESLKTKGVRNSAHWIEVVHQHYASETNNSNSLSSILDNAHVEDPRFTEYLYQELHRENAKIQKDEFALYDYLEKDAPYSKSVIKSMHEQKESLSWWQTKAHESMIARHARNCQVYLKHAG